jgi:hypothetical protein
MLREVNAVCGMIMLAMTLVCCDRRLVCYHAATMKTVCPRLNEEGENGEVQQVCRPRRLPQPRCPCPPHSSMLSDGVHAIASLAMRVLMQSGVIVADFTCPCRNEEGENEASHRRRSQVRACTHVTHVHPTRARPLSVYTPSAPCPCRACFRHVRCVCGC